MKRLPLIIAGIIFSIAALMHVLRLIYHWQVVIGGYIVPMSHSIISLIFIIILAIWMFIAAAKN